MMLDGLHSTVRRLRRDALQVGNGTGLAAPLGRTEIERLLPHRGQMLLLNSIDALDLDSNTIEGRLALHDDDPVFDGHFPGEPIYPGVLLVEAMGQLGLCLFRLKSQFDASRAEGTRIRATRIHHAAFFEPVTPGAPVVLRATLVEDDGMLLVAGGQTYQRERLCALSVLEAYAIDA